MEVKYSELFIDIETIPAGDPIDPKTMPHPAGMSKQETIDNWYKTKAPTVAEEKFRKRALNSMEGELLCIGYAFDNEDALILDGKNEEEIYFKFNEIIKSIPTEVLLRMDIIGHNIKEFDAKWLYRGAVKYGFQETIRFLSGYSKWNSLQGMRKMMDTMEMWGYMTHKEHTSMESIANFLGIEGKPDGIDGSKVYDFFKDGKKKDIFEYCKNDVVVLRNIFRRLITIQ